MATEGILSMDNVGTRMWLKTDVGWLASCNPSFWERHNLEGAGLGRQRTDPEASGVLNIFLL